MPRKHPRFCPQAVAAQGTCSRERTWTQNISPNWKTRSVSDTRMRVECTLLVFTLLYEESTDTILQSLYWAWRTCQPHIPPQPTTRALFSPRTRL